MRQLSRTKLERERDRRLAADSNAMKIAPAKLSVTTIRVIQRLRDMQI
jgi:hypothetical protein